MSVDPSGVMLGVAKIAVRASFTDLEKELSQATTKVEKAFAQTGTIMRKVGAGLMTVFTAPLSALITTSTVAASKVHEFELINDSLGRSLGYSSEYVREMTKSIADQGFTAEDSAKTMAQFLRANIDIADAARIATIAQDAAALTGKKSTDVLEKLTTAIISGRTQLFRSSGVLIDLTSSYDSYAKSLGKTRQELTEYEKLQARVNATIEAGSSIQGAYEASLAGPAAVIKQFPLYLNDIQVAMGRHFLPAFFTGAKAVEGLLLSLKDMISDGGSLQPVMEAWGDSVSRLARTFSQLVESFSDIHPGVFKTGVELAGILAVMGPLLFAGGQLLIWASKFSTAMGVLTTTLGASASALFGVAGAIGAAIVGLIAFDNQVQAVTTQADRETRLLAESSSSYEEYASKVKEAQGEVAEFNLVTGDMSGALILGMQQIKKNAAEIRLLSEEEYNLIKTQDELLDSLEDTSEGFSLFSEAIEEALATLASPEFEMSRLDAMLKGDLTNSTKAFSEKVRDLNGHLMELRLEMTSLYDKKKEQGGWLSSEDQEELEALQVEFQKVQSEITSTADAHEEATKRIVFGILTQQIAMLGLPFEETMALIGGVAEAWGLVDEATGRVWDSTAQLLSEYITGKITIEEFVKSIDQIKDKTMNFTVKYSWTGDAGPGYRVSPEVIGGGAPTQINVPRAAGGPVDPTRSYLVGERGIEFFKPASAGAILSNHTLRTLANLQHSGGTDSEILDTLVKFPTAEDIARVIKASSSESSQSFQLVANYPMQSEVSLIQQLKLLEALA